MNNCQFKFKPDKIKYLSNIDTLDSTHKKTIDSINKKHDDIPKKEKKVKIVAPKKKRDDEGIEGIEPEETSIRTIIRNELIQQIREQGLDSLTVDVV